MALGNVAAAELRSFSGAATQPEEAAWLVEHGMLAQPETPYDIVTDADWAMPGSEAYILHFSVRPEACPPARFVMKACMVAPATATVDDWVQRRSLLATHQVEVPRLHAAERGTLIEEYISHDLRAAYRQGEADTRAQLADNFKRTFRLVREAGFRPLGLHDVRSRGSDVVLIDFGSDLGGAKTLPEDFDPDAVRQEAGVEFGKIVGISLQS
jgi:hypothetical protein